MSQVVRLLSASLISRLQVQTTSFCESETCPNHSLVGWSFSSDNGHRHQMIAGLA
jgi:hypothetical protein